MGNLINISNWETDADMDVYGAVYGSLRVVHDIIPTLMQTLANVLGPVKVSSPMALKLLVFYPALGKKRASMFGN